MRDRSLDEPSIAEPLRLPGEVEALWSRYLESERAGVRVRTLEALANFLARFTALDGAIRERWALEFLWRKLDAGEDLPVRIPLFEQVLFPVLADLSRARDPRGARWLACLSDRLRHSRSCWESLGRPRDLDLKREAYRLNPGDEALRRTLVGRMASQIAYTLHELPAGVLFGVDGATSEQCAVLQQELEEFRSLLRGAEVGGYRDLIARASFHYRHYPEYLRHRGEHAGYADYLASVEPG